MMIISFIEEKVHIKCIVSEGLQSSSSYNSGPRSYESSYNAPIRYLIFCQAGHNSHDLIALGLKLVRSKDPFVLRAREHLLIKKFDSFRNGLNQEP